MTAVVWFRRDLRLADNPAWSAATRNHERVVALFVIDPRIWDRSPRRRTQLLAAHLASLDATLAEGGGRLLVAAGDPTEKVVAAASGVDAVYWNDDYTPYAHARDDRLAAMLQGRIHRYDGVAFHPPGAVLTGAGAAYRVFTPFWRRWRDLPWALPDAPRPVSLGSKSGVGVPDHPVEPGAGEAAAHARLAAYARDRDRPDIAGTSGLSSDLKFGTISPRRVRAEIGETTPGREAFARQLCWRDFYMQLIAANPETATRPFRPEYSGIRWHDDPDGFQAWTEGRTGYPIVDAAMRQLSAEGWIHNRLRMIAASFLVKDLLIDWRLGERWFMQQLIDGDLSQNVGNWQWVAGTGADAAPYFRVLNPVTQAKRFDPDGDYVRHWIGELAALEGPAIHAPWELAPLELASAGVVLGETYPAPIVVHAEARARVIDAFEQARGSRGAAPR
jgi:deoxyribodipyrimidine photo-lyase